jgi:hypothetical protein
VIRGAEVTIAEAVQERRAGRDIVVCDGEHRDNYRVAVSIELMIGVYQRHSPHLNAGQYALPHVQQLTPPPEGHTFYETDRRKAAHNP